MKIECEIIQGIGKKSGKPYVRVEIPITDTYSKVVFLEPVEQALFEVTYNN